MEPEGHVGRRFLYSTLAAYGSQIGRSLIRAVHDLVLARLVLPEGHGLFDYAWSVVLVAALVRDAGLPYQLVRDEERPYGTVWVWSLGSGLLITAALVLGAPLFGEIDPQLPPAVQVLALYVLLDAFAVVPRVFFERRLEVGRLVVPEVLRGAVVAAVAIALGLAGQGVWSLVAGELAGAALYAALLWLRVRGRLTVEVRLALLPDLLARSRYLFFIALAAYSLPQLERFVLAPFVSTALLGQYGKARLWALRLQALILPVVARTLYPALVEYRHDRERFLGAYRMGTVTILALEVLAAYVLFVNAEVLMLRILAGENWGPAVPLVRILCFLPLVDPFTRLGGELLKVKYDDRAWLAVVVLNSASLVGFGILLTQRLGAAGMAWANFLLLGNLVMAWRVWRICGPEFWRLARDLVFLYLVPLPLFLAVAWTCPAASWPRLGASVLAAGAALGVYVWRFRGPFRELFARGE